MFMTTQNPKANPRRYPVRWLLGAALAGLLAGGCSNGKAKDDKDDAKTAAVPVETQPLKRAEMVAVYSGTAPIEAHDEAQVVAKVGGEVRRIYVEEGDTVKEVKKRKLEEVERDVVAQDGIDLAEWHRVAGHQPRIPATRRV